MGQTNLTHRIADLHKQGADALNKAAGAHQLRGLLLDSAQVLDDYSAALRARLPKLDEDERILSRLFEKDLPALFDGLDPTGRQYLAAQTYARNCRKNLARAYDNVRAFFKTVDKTVDAIRAVCNEGDTAVATERYRRLLQRLLRFLPTLVAAAAILEYGGTISVGGIEVTIPEQALSSIFMEIGGPGYGL
jgi:hypothetical protein